MKILFLINCLGYGGAEKNLKLVAEHLSSSGHSVTVCSLNYRPSVMKFNSSIRVVELENRNGYFLKVLYQKYKELKIFIKEETPDVIVSFLLYSNVLNVLVGKSLKIPSVISERGNPYLKAKSIKSSFMMWIFHLIFNMADGGVFQTEQAKNFFSKRLRRKSAVIPNPVIVPQVVPIHDYNHVSKSIAFVGRFETVQKRQDIMVAAFCKVLDKYNDYQLIFWGDGENQKQIEELVRKNGIESHVVFKGVSKNVLNDINECEIYVLTSDYEGIPNTLIEAMSIGMPCVATDCAPGGARLLINSNINGLLVPCGDVEEISSAIIYYIENPNKAQECGQNAVKIKDTFSYSVIMEKWNNYINSIVKNYE